MSEDTNPDRIDSVRDGIVRFWLAIDRPILPALIVLAVACFLVEGELDEREEDWSAFIVAGSWFIDAEAIPDPIVITDGPGYDGQFFYRLALDPWTPEHHEFGGTLDSPAWRHQRILYPVLSWLAAGGSPGRVPEALVIVNLLAMAAAAYGGGSIARSIDRHSIWGIMPGLYPGFFLSLTRDTAEIVTGAMILGAIACLANESRTRMASAGATIFLSLAVLSRETAVLIAGSIMVVWVFEKVRKLEMTVSWHQGLVPIAVLGVWHLMLRARWGVFPADQGGGNIGRPLEGLTMFVIETLDRENHWEEIWLRELEYMLIFTLITLAVLIVSKAPRVTKVAYVAYLGLATVLTRSIWIEDWSFLRALTELHLLATIIVIGAPRWARIVGLIVWLVFIRMIFHDVDKIR